MRLRQPIGLTRSWYTLDNTTITACRTQVGTKHRIPVVHLEARLHSGDQSMPEEVNRLITDAIADVLAMPVSEYPTVVISESI